MWFSWHGSASFSLRIGKKEILIDPSFSQIADYGSWYIPNLNAPDFSLYFTNYQPDYVLLSHGHFDHFDLHTIKKIERVKAPKYIGSPEITAALEEYFNIPAERLISVKPNDPLSLNGDLMITANVGEHYLTGLDGTKAALKFKGRTDRYGVMPCGGPMLNFIINSVGERIYISGDSLIGGIPNEQVDIAIMCVGGPLFDPVSKQKFKAIIDIDDAVVSAEKFLQPRFIIPIHYDFKYMDAIDMNEFTAKMQSIKSHPEVITPPYNTWVEINT